MAQESLNSKNLHSQKNASVPVRDCAPEAAGERLSQIVLDEMQQGVVTIRDDRAIVYANSSFAELVGQSRDELTGQTFDIFIASQDCEAFQQLVAHSHEGKCSAELLLKTANGQSKQARLSVCGRDSAISNFVSIIVTVLDHEHRLSESDHAVEFLRGTFESLPDGVMTTNAKGEIGFLNDVAVRLTGWSNCEARGQPLESLFVILDEQTGQQLPSPAECCLQNGLTVGMTHRAVLMSKDGSRLFIELDTSLISGRDGQSLGSVLVFRDVTDRKRADAAIRETQSRLQSKLVAGEIGTWDFNVVTDSFDVDANLARMFGMHDETRARASLSDFLAAVHPKDSKRVRLEMAKAIHQGEVFESNFRVRDSEGNIRWVIARSSSEFDEIGQVARISGVVVDITGQHQAEEKLRDSEARRRLALDAAELGAWNIDPATSTLTTDERFRIIFAGNTEPLGYEQAFAAIHPDDREFVREKVAASVNPQDPKPYSAEYRVVHPDGTLRWVFAKGRAHFEEHFGERALVSFDGTIADITDRRRADEAIRESEANLRQLADAIPQLVWTARPDGYIDWYNDRWYEYTGMTFEDMQGWGWQAVHDPNVLPSVMERWTNALRTGENAGMDFPLRGADGVFRQFLTRVVALRDGDGTITRWFGTCTDISEQHKMQEELRRIAAELSESDRRKDEFLATLAHELRNPLAPIKSATQLMQMVDDDPAEYRELSEMIDRQVVHMARLIDDLLDISRISRGKITLQSHDCDLKDVIENALESVAPVIDQAGHDLHVQITEEPLLLHGDATRLSQVLVNLVNNAAKYTIGPGEIWLTANRVHDEAWLDVRDSGIGIAESDLQSVFEMFHQLGEEKQKGQGGLGIGLSLVQSLISLHGGTVEAMSPGIGQGSTFRVRLPLIQSHDASVQSAPLRSSEEVPRRLMKVLVVEDTRANRIALVRLLEALGHQVAEACDGLDGLAKIQDFQPEIILSDISMPKMNGYEMVRRLRETDQSTHVIALSGYGQADDRLAAEAAGFNGYLVKPVDVKELEQLFESLAHPISGFTTGE